MTSPALARASASTPATRAREHSRGLRIMHVLAPAPIGGRQTMVRELALAQSREGDDVRVVTVLTPRSAAYPFVESLVQCGCDVRAIEVSRRAYAREWTKVAGEIAHFQPDVVHTHGYRADVLHGAFGKHRGLSAVVTTIHGFSGGDLRNRAYEELQRATLRRFDAVVAVSRPLARSLILAGVAPARLRCIVNVISPPGGVLDRGAARDLLGLPQDAYIAAWIGRLAQEKAPEVFIDSLSLLEGRGVRGSIIGDGPLRAEVEQRIASSPLNGVIRQHGSVAGIAALMRAFDVLVLTSRREGTPITLLEAIWSGVPIIATRVGGIPDLLSRNEAVLVAPDDHALVAQAVVQLQEQPQLGRQLSTAAMARARREHSLGAWVQAYRDVYQDALRRSISSA
jgi:glycosyltransferase involved in cell wall biosynthesis